MSFLISMVQLVQEDPTHTHTLHTIHTHTHSTVKESCLAWFVVADHEEGEAEVKKVESLYVALFGKTCRSGTAGCSRPAALTFRQCSKAAEARTAQICSRVFMVRVLELDLSLDLISKNATS